MTNPDQIAAHLRQLSLCLVQQVEQAGGWPDRLTFPAPADDAEREALRLFITELEQETGVPVQFVTEPEQA